MGEAALRLLLLQQALSLTCLADDAATATTGAPRGCGASVSSLYYNLCDLSAAWGVVVEAFAAAGVATSFLLLVTLAASLPFVTDGRRKGMAALLAAVLVFTLGLFGLSFAFVVGRDSASCAARRFLFGVLFAGCLSCLVTHGLWLALLKRGGRGPRAWVLCLGALALWLVEVIVNAEWLIITLARSPAAAAAPLLPAAPDLRSCEIANQDFVMALIYVMALLLSAVLTAVPALTHEHRPWRRDAAFVLATAVFSAAIWAAWIVMYVHGNRLAGEPGWDDPTLAIALVANAWVFLVLYVVPEICSLTREDGDRDPPADGEHVYPARSLVYDNILKEQSPSPLNMYMENKAFSMDEPRAAKKLVSPYQGYNGQLRSCVYQPTELALISKGLANRDKTQETILPRATSPSPHQGAGGVCPSPRSAEPLPSPGLAHPGSGSGLNRRALW